MRTPERSGAVLVLGEVMRVLVADDGAALARAEAFRSTIGGAEANVAVGLARLGFPAAWLGRVGDDDAGAYVLRRLRAEGIDVSLARTTPGFTGLLLRNSSSHGAISVSYHRAGSAGASLDADHVDSAWAAGPPRLVHVTGITAMLSPAANGAVRRVVELAERDGVPLSFDVNLRLRLAPAEQWPAVLAPLARSASLVFAGADELDLLPGGREQAVEELLAAGVRAVIRKDHDHSATVAWSDGHPGSGGAAGSARQTPLAKAVVDPVGAGDALVAGYLSGYLRELPPAECLRRGAAVAAFAIGNWSDTDGLPSVAEVERFLAAFEGGEQVMR